VSYEEEFTCSATLASSRASDAPGGSGRLGKHSQKSLFSTFELQRPLHTNF
jgi:hypothetical protein